MNIFVDFFRKENFLYTKISIWLCLIYFPIFLNLGGLVMQQWDEARYGTSSYEMLHGSNPFVVTFYDQPSMGSAKPPLLHWMQASFIALLGFNETAVRLPSAFAGLFVCFAVMYVSIKKFNSFSLGAICSLILITTPDGFCGMDHSVRTGDYDAMLCMFSFLGILSFFQYNENTSISKYLVLTFVFFTLAVLTKAVAGLFFAPGMIVYVIVKGNLTSLIKNKWLYYSILFFIVTIGFVFLIREYYTPGYLQALNENEFLGRHNTSLDGHVGDFWYYLSYIKQRFGYFFLFIPLSWLFGISCKEKKIRNISLFLFILSTTFFIVISSSKSKLQWYAFPLFPLLAFQAGILVWALLKKLIAWIALKQPVNKISVFYLSLVFMFSVIYIESAEDANHRIFDEDLLNFYNAEEYLKQERDVIKNGIIATTYNDGIFKFYYHKLNENGFNLGLETGIRHYEPGDKLIVEEPILQEQIEKKYNVAILDQYRHLKVYRIISKKL